MFINFSNHPFLKWTEEQLNAAKMHGELIEVPFPQVSATASKEQIRELAKEYVSQIMEYKPDVVMCQGEFTLTFRVVSMLQELGVRCVSACSERNSREIMNADGSITKESVFCFRQFRDF